MSLLQEIKRDVTDDKISLTVVLRKCKILAAELDNEKLAEWVSNEQNGYTEIENCPDYRKLKTQSFGTLVDGYSISQNVPIPPSSLPEDLREWCVTDYLMRGVAFYEHNLLDEEIKKNGLRILWHADAIAITANHFRKTGNPSLVEAWKALAVSSIAGLLDTVRNRVLDFVLEIEKKYPNVGEESFNKEAVDEKIVDRMVQMNFYGETVFVNHADAVNVQIVKQGDFDSLARFLKSIGYKQSQIAELDKAINEDGIPKSRTGLGKKIAAWLKKNAANAAVATGSAVATASGEKVTEALFKYFGI